MFCDFFDVLSVMLLDLCSNRTYKGHISFRILKKLFSNVFVANEDTQSFYFHFISWGYKIDQRPKFDNNHRRFLKPELPTRMSLTISDITVVDSAIFHPGNYIIGNTCRDRLMRTKFVKRNGIPNSRGLLKNFAMYR